LCQYAARGGSFALVIAVVVVSIGVLLLASVGIATIASYMAVVGYTEEYGKLVAVTCGTALMASMYQVAANSCHCSCLCRSLVESPRALIISGFAAGFGFMTVENGLYVMSSAVIPPMKIVTTGTGGGVQEIDDEATQVGTVATIVIRILFNIHPWLSGLCAARIAAIAFKENKGTACLSTSDIIWAITPSSIIHASFNVLVTILPGAVALPCVPIIWYGSKRWFQEEWNVADDIDWQGKRSDSGSEANRETIES
jgi:RsiW-degrading membrane proteinase PrsW (M82 family)